MVKCGLVVVDSPILRSFARFVVGQWNALRFADKLGCPTPPNPQLYAVMYQAKAPSAHWGVVGGWSEG